MVSARDLFKIILGRVSTAPRRESEVSHEETEIPIRERFAIISDIHSNLEALLAVLNNINLRGISKIFCAGDLVGYGANPNKVVDKIREMNIPCVVGNHDYAINNPEHLVWFNEYARKALEWTMNKLSDENKRFLEKLPEIYNENRHFVMLHGSPGKPVFEYIKPYLTKLIEESSNAAVENFKKNILIVGHTHIPFLYVKAGDENPESKTYYNFLPPRGTQSSEIQTLQDIVLKTECNYSGEPDNVDTAKFHINRNAKNLQILLNPGSVGQPRDHYSKASYSILDITDKEVIITFVRVPYDIKAASNKILKEGLPEFLAARLYGGI